MSRVEVHNGQQEHKQSPSMDEFPTLNHAATASRDNGNRRGGYGYGRGEGYDPSRTRFARVLVVHEWQSNLRYFPSLHTYIGLA